MKAAQLVVAVALFAVATPAARAADRVELGQGQADASASLCFPTNTVPNPFCVSRGDATGGLTFAFNDGIVDDGSSASARHDMTTTDTAGGISILSDAAASVSGGSPPPCLETGDFPHPGCPGAGMNLARDFTVTQPVDWRISGTLGGVGRAGIELIGGFGGDLEGGDGPGPFSGGGTLQPGVYSFAIRTVIGSDSCGGPCTTSWQVRFEVGNPRSPVAIGSGPSGLTNQRNATFEFTALNDPPPGRLECRVDGSGAAAFTPCSSPLTITGLADGEHRFEVRYHPDGEIPGAPTERRWTVDTTPPAVVFDHAPSGLDNPPEAEFVFHSTESAGATFRCGLDNGQLFECSSPHAVFGLAPGLHSFSVEAFDAAGNSSPPSMVDWVVGETVLQTADCTAPAASSAGFGVIRLVSRAADACFVDAIVGGEPAKVARGEVTLNGIRLAPEPGTRIIVSRRIGDGTVRADGPLEIGVGAISFRLAALDLDRLVTSSNLLNKEILFGESLLQVAGLPAVPAVQLELSDKNGGQTKATFRLTLPRVAFKRLPGGTETTGITVEFTPTLSNDKGVTFGGRLKIPQVHLFGKVKIKNVDLAYDHGTGVFDGSFALSLGAPRPGHAEPTLTGAIGLAPTAEQCGVTRIGIEASNLQKHIGDGVFLQRIGGNFRCVSEGGNVLSKLTANGGVSLGPRIALGSTFRLEAVSVDGEATLTIPVGSSPPGPFSFEIKGTGKIVDVPVTEQIVKYTTAPATIEVNGSIDLTVGGYGARLEQRNSFVSEEAFNIEAAGQANLFGFQTAAEGVFSTTGYAVCMGPPDHHLGFGRRWGEDLESWVQSCDVGPFRAAVPARAAQGGPLSFEVRKGNRPTVVAVEGEGGPPTVVLTGPGGVRIETPAGGAGTRSDQALVVPDSGADTTFIGLFSPRAGRWTVTAAEGSAPIRRLRVADGLPPVKLRVKVTGKGAKRTLSWRATGLNGQRLQLADTGRGSIRPLITSTKRRGRVVFTPDSQLGAKRTIKATVLNRGLPRLTRTVARYRVSQPRARRIHGIRLTRGALTWKAQRGIASYEIAVTRPDRTTTSHTTHAARLKLKGLPRRGTLRVQILALDATGRPGPVTKAGIRLARRGRR